MIEIVSAGEILQRRLAVQAFELSSSQAGVGSSAWRGKQGLRQALGRSVGVSRPRGRDCPRPLLPLMEGWARPPAPGKQGDPCPPWELWWFASKPVIVCKLLSFKLMFCSSPLKQSPSRSHGKGISKGVGFFPLFPLASSLCSVWQAGISANK